MRHMHKPYPAQQRGVALFIVIIFVMLSMLLALWASRTAWFNEMIVGNDADYQRAFEAAQASLDFGFNHLKLNEIVAFTAHSNIPSQNLMTRLGMNKVKTFIHPDVIEQSSLNPHILYAINNPKNKEA